MGFGSEIRFKIGGDSSSLEKTFDRSVAKAESAGKRMDRALSSKMGLENDRARGALARYREQSVFREANTIGKIKIVTNELSDLAAQRAGFEKNSTGYLKTQLQIEERRAKLKQLQGQAQQERADQTDMPRQAASTKTSNWGGIVMRAIGGGIALVLEGIMARNQGQIDIANAKGASSQASLDSMRGKFSSIGGLEGTVRQGVGSMKDLQEQKRFEEDRLKFLNGSAFQRALQFGPGGTKAVVEAETNLARINAEIQKIGDSTDLNQRELDKTTETYQAQADFLSIQNRLREHGMASEGKLAEYALRRAAAQQEIEERLGTPQTVNAAKLAVQEAAQQEAAIAQATRARLLDVNQNLTSQAAEGRPGRGRSETERLAQRAERFRQRARNAVLTGAGSDAAHFMESAISGEAGVASRLSGASAGVGKLDAADWGAVKSEIVRSNQLLEGIQSALTITDVSVGPQSGQFVDASGSGGG